MTIDAMTTEAMTTEAMTGDAGRRAATPDRGPDDPAASMPRVRPSRVSRRTVARRKVIRQRAAGALLCIGVLASQSACAGQGNAELGNAKAAAAAFGKDVSAATGDACDLLAPQTLKELEDSEGPCATSLPDQVRSDPGAVRGGAVYGKEAIVHLAADTVFLARYRDGWRVTAAGCTRPQAGRPYDCKVKGD